jgi:hypothetical protein
MKVFIGKRRTTLPSTPSQSRKRCTFEALDVALAGGKTRIGFDWKGSVNSTWRTTLQFRVDESLYDWFFNAHTGYRALFLVGCETGLAFNARMITRLRAVIERQLTGPKVRGHNVRVDPDHRRDISEGTMSKCLPDVLASVEPSQAKVWVCERLLPEGKVQGEAREICTVRDGCRLDVPRWIRARAPCRAGDTWLDLKTGVLRADGKVDQRKRSDERAWGIHCGGWS